MDKLLAIQLLLECRGDEIWSRQLCRERDVPDAWWDELADAHESGFRHAAQEIWTDRGRVNQYEGLADVRLAVRLASCLGIVTSQWEREPISPRELVRRIQAELDEL